MTPFQLKDVCHSCGATNFDTIQTPAANLKTDTYWKFEFITHNNAVQGIVMGHGTSGDALMCPKSVLVHRVLYLG